MYILGIKTDQPTAHVILLQDTTVIEDYSWEAHRSLARDLLATMNSLLDRHSLKLEDLSGLVLFHGPGSFTGLRIGASVTNALSDALQIKAVGVGGDDWLQVGVKRICDGESDGLVVLEYGGQIHITIQKK
jgi:tRNA threonylcarbamoyladenosine biosynthesis protein TsaB